MSNLGNSKSNLLGKKELSNKYSNENDIVDLDEQNDSHSIIARELLKKKKKITVLDVGCGSGLIGKFVFYKDNIIIDGIEIDSSARKCAESVGKYRKIYDFSIDSIIGNDVDLPRYDVIIFADVLEHLVNPHEILLNIKKYLVEDGFILVSIPNISHVDIIKNLIDNNFNYNTVGLLDTTHLRFFTDNSFLEMIKNINESSNIKYDVSYIASTYVYPDDIDKDSDLLQIINMDNKKFILQNIFKLYLDDSKEQTSLNKLLSEKHESIFDNLKEQFEQKKVIQQKISELMNENKIYSDMLRKADVENKKNYDKLCIIEKNNRDLLNSLLFNINVRRDMESKYYSIIDSRSWKLFNCYFKSKNVLRKGKNKLLRLKSKVNIQDVNVVEESINQENRIRISTSELVDKLKKYDVISFDMFDTLVFRAVLNPTNLFQIMEINNCIDNFSKMRIEAEKVARNKTKKKNFEINIFDIYDEVSKYLDIDKEKMINEELELEKNICYANQYMLEVFNKLRKLNKKIIITSDMYWPKDYLKQILEKCGYKGYSNLFVSCDAQLNKGNGEIQKYISKTLKTTNIIHVGDNYYSDIDGSSKALWDTYYYKNIKELALENGELIYDDSLLDSIVSSLKVNYLYSGYNKWNNYFKYGFCYGGILTCGFLDYIDTQMETKKLDKILFMARDAKILYDVYNKYYKNYDNDYFITSRSAMLEISFEKKIKTFVDFYFRMRANIAQYTIEDSLVQTDLKVLLPKVKEYGLNLNDILSCSNFDTFEKMVYDNKKEIIKYFSDSKKYALDYIKNVLGDSKRILCVDLGWSGTIVTLLRDFLKENVGPDIETFGTFIGNNDTFKVNCLIDNGIFMPYCFGYNNKHNSLNVGTIEGSSKAMFLEAMFTSTDPTLLKYDKQFLYGNKTNNEVILNEIHDGIMKFVELYKSLNISGIDKMKINSEVAFRPIFEILKNYNYNYEIFKNFQEYKDSLPRFSGDRELTTLGQILKDRGMI